MIRAVPERPAKVLAPRMHPSNGADPGPEDVGGGFGIGPRGPYDSAQPGQPFTDPIPEQSVALAGQVLVVGYLLPTAHRFRENPRVYRKI